MKDLRADLQADLLADLTPAAPAPVEVTETAPLPPDLADATPALTVQLTPLRWSRPRVVSARGGLGKALKAGPWRVELSVRE
jgi:hypothetical protein